LSDLKDFKQANYHVNKERDWTKLEKLSKQFEERILGNEAD